MEDDRESGQLKTPDELGRKKEDDGDCALDVCLMDERRYTRKGIDRRG